MSLKTTQSPAERTTHSYPGAQYLLPSDEEERQRLLSQHKVYTRLFSDRLVFPSISFSKNDEILDIGTGAGAWLCDARAHLPESVQLYGIDIESRLFPAPSANVHLSICSGTDLPSDWSFKFTLVNQRLLLCAYTREQWRRCIDEIYRVLVPGGYVQLIEPGPDWASGPKTATYILFLDDLFGSRGLMSRCPVYIADMLKATGFVDVKSEEVVMALGKWAGEDGVQASEATLGGFRGMRDSVMRVGGFGRFASNEEYDEAINGVEEEWDNMEGSHTIVTVVHGRKPL